MSELLYRHALTIILVVSFLVSVLSNGAENLSQYDALSQIAAQNGFQDLADNAIQLKNYRVKLNQCTKESGSESSEEIKQFLDNFANTVWSYTSSNSLISSRFRAQVEDYIMNGVSLFEAYLDEKALRFEGDAAKLSKEDAEIRSLVENLHLRCAQLLQTRPGSTATMVAAWKKTDLTKYESDGHWGHGAKAILKIRSGDKMKCGG